MECDHKDPGDNLDLRNGHKCAECGCELCDGCETQCERCEEYVCEDHYIYSSDFSAFRTDYCLTCFANLQEWEAERAYCRAHGYKFQ